MCPLVTLPETTIRSSTGMLSLHGERTVTWPLRTETSSVSTVMPGLVRICRWPLLTLASISRTGSEMTARVKSSITCPLVTPTSRRRGTTHWPSRRAWPLPHWIFIRPFGAGRLAGRRAASGLAGRSAVNGTRSA
jgi:hypothetical protein